MPVLAITKSSGSAGTLISQSDVDKVAELQALLDENPELAIAMDELLSRYTFEDAGSSNMAWSVTDSNGNILIGIDVDGNLITGQGRISLPYSLNAYNDGDLVATVVDSNYAWALVDNDDNILLGIGPDGSLHANLFNEEIEPEQSEVYMASGDYLFTSDYESPAYAIKYQNIVTGMSGVAIETSSEVSSIRANEGCLLYSIDGVKYWSKGPDFKKQPVNSLDEVVCWGDSLTAGAGATYSTSYPLVLGSITSIPTVNQGVSGQTSSEIAARAGALDVVITVSSNTIPATVQSVPLSSVNQSPLSSQGPQSSTGSIGDVSGVLSRTGVDTYEFARDSDGDAIDTTGGVIFRPDLDGYEDRIISIWVGRNNALDTDAVLSDIAALVDGITSYVKRFVVMTVVNTSSETLGTTNHTSITLLNDQIMSLYPDNHIDIRAFLVNSYDPSDAQDVIDYADAITPSTLRSDTVHLTAEGYALVADQVKNFLTNKGWI